MRTTWNFHSAGQLLFGFDAVDQLAPLLRRRNWHSLFVVTDRRLIDAGVVQRVLSPLPQGEFRLDLFEDGEAEPSLSVAEQAVSRARAQPPDLILAIGGGSNMDLAKVTAVAVTHGGHPRDYFGWDRVPGPVLPLVCIPTTAGTGSEVSHAAVVTDIANKIKVSTLSQYLRPAIAIVDPGLTMTCPRSVTADSGIDALTHAIEAYTAIDYQQLDPALGDFKAYEGKFPLADCLAERAIELIGRHLECAVNEPGNRAAREGMALAATLAGLAFSNAAVALVHALEYPLGGALHCSHGAGNGLLLPYVMRFNLPQSVPEMAQIARLLGAAIDGQSELELAESGIVAIERLRERIGIPTRIRDLGGTRDQLPGFASKAFAISRLRQVNRRTSSESDLLEILHAAW